jgi:hypothetical protein
MAVYQSAQYPFAITYPATWTEQTLSAEEKESYTAFFTNEEINIFGIAEEDLIEYGFGKTTLDEYVELASTYFDAVGAEILSSERRLTAQGLPIEVIEVSLMGGMMKGKRLIYMHENSVAFSASYMLPRKKYLEMDNLIEYSFSTFRVLEPTNVIFQDDFSDESSGWEPVKDWYYMDYIDGTFQMFTFTHSYNVIAHPKLDISDSIIEVELTNIKNTNENFMGVACRLRDHNNLYAFGITGDGYANILKTIRGKWERLDNNDESDWINLKDGVYTGDEAIYLRAKCIGPYLIFYVNEILVATVVDNELASGDVGLFVFTGEEQSNQIIFDNFKVSQP